MNTPIDTGNPPKGPARIAIAAVVLVALVVWLVIFATREQEPRPPANGSSQTEPTPSTPADGTRPRG